MTMSREPLFDSGLSRGVKAKCMLFFLGKCTISGSYSRVRRDEQIRFSVRRIWLALSGDYVQ